MAFTKEELEIIFQLATDLTGSNQDGSARRESLANNVARRMQMLDIADLATYLELVEEEPVEYDQLISCLTIHTTQWFREMPHYHLLREKLEKSGKKFNKENPFRVWCAACSTGEEVYSFALVLEQYKKFHPEFEYTIRGTDIDAVSVATARAAIYSDQYFSSIPVEYIPLLLKGEGKTEGLFTLCKDVRDRCKFTTHNLTLPVVSILSDFPEKFDFIVCRNVLIYFKPDDVDLIISNLLRKLHPQGTLCLGHSESIEPKKHNLCLITNSNYRFSEACLVGTGKANAPSPKKILIVDDSKTIRQMLLKCLQDSEFEGVAVASAKEATEYLKNNNVDLITLDLHMPEEDGPTWLKRMRQRGMKTPVFIISDASPAEANSVLGALENGAQDYIEKGYLQKNKGELLERIREVVDSYELKKTNAVSVRKSKDGVVLFRPDMILIGASTGGTNALGDLLKNFPKDTPPVVVVQHISREFCEPFARRLSSLSGLPLGDCQKSGPLKPGHLYLAFSDYHLSVVSRGGAFWLAPSEAPLMNRHRPSVDYLFHSASLTQAKCLAVLLTGMGKDGAQGMLELNKKGAVTFAQDEKSSIVFGMPGEAIKLGGASYVGNLEEIRQQLERALSSTNQRTG